MDLSKLKTDCKEYISLIRSKKISAFYADEANLEYNSFTGTIVPTKYDYKSMIGEYVGGDINSTMSVGQYPDDLGNPYIIFPIGNMSYFINENIDDLRNAIYLSPLSFIYNSSVTMDKNISFYSNIVNLFWAIGERYGVNQSDRATKTKMKVSSDEINKRIRLLKGKISLAKRSIKDPDKQNERVVMLQNAIKALRQQRQDIKTDTPEQTVIKVSEEAIKGLGYLSIHYFIAGKDMPKYLNEQIKNKFIEKMSSAVGQYAKEIKNVKADIFNVIDNISAGYKKNNNVLLEDAEILMTCNSLKYYAIKYTPENIKEIEKAIGLKLLVKE